MDINELRKLLQSGAISPDDLQNMNVSGSSSPNELAQMLQPMPQPRYDIPPMQQNTMRVETGPDAGKVTNLNFAPQAPQGGIAQNPPMQPQQMQVVGMGNGTMVNLPPEQMNGQPRLDLSRAPVDVMGAKAYYSKDEPGVAYVMGPQGPKKVILGYDMQGSMALNKYNLEQQKTQGEIAHTQEQIRASQVNNPDMGMMQPNGAAAGLPNGVTGPEFLQTLDPQIAAQVKAYAEGRLAFPAGFALKSPYFQQMMRLVGQYDPTFDATNYNNRAKTRADASTGTMSKSNNALNTVAEHMGNLSDKIDNLDTVSGFPGATLVNSVINAVERSAGSTNITDFNSTKGHVAEELVRAWRGVGGNESDIQRNLQDLDAANTKAQLHSVVGNIADLIAGKISANENQYKQGMGPAADVNKPQFISPSAQKTFERIAARAKGLSVQPEQGASNIPADAIAHLRQNPQLRTAFDMKYGQGASAQVLGQ